MAEKLFYTGIDLQQNELKNAVIQKSATAPENAVEGQIYFDTVTHKLMSYSGTAWAPVCADALTIAAGSSDYLAIANGELSIKALAITDVVVNNTETTLSAFVAAHYTAGNEYQEGDVIILTAATDASQRRFIHNGGTAGTTADFTAIDSVLSSSEVRGYLSASSGISYNSGTGEFTADVDDSTIQVGASGLEVKDDGITQAKLAPALEAKIVNAYAQTVGDGSATSFSITHNLGTKDVMVNIYKVDTGECVQCNVARTSDNAISVGAFPAPASNNLRVLIQKMNLA